VFLKILSTSHNMYLIIKKNIYIHTQKTLVNRYTLHGTIGKNLEVKYCVKQND